MAWTQTMSAYNTMPHPFDSLGASDRALWVVGKVDGEDGTKGGLKDHGNMMWGTLDLLHPMGLALPFVFPQAYYWMFHLMATQGTVAYIWCDSFLH